MEEYVIEIPVCRVCLQTSVECIEMDSLMMNEIGVEESQTYFECFKSCTKLDVKFDDGLPNLICSLCSMELRAANDFITKAKNSHEILLMQLEDIKPEYILHEYDSHTNDLSEEAIYLPIENVDEIYEEETDDFTDMVVKVEQDEAEMSEKEDDQGLEEEKQQQSESDLVENTSEANSESEERIEELNDETLEYREKIKCNLCHLVFDKLEDLREHGDCEHHHIPFSCSTCHHRFRSKYTLADHIKRKHDGTYVKCNICEASVKKILLRVHKKQMHRKTPFLCTACPRTFKTTTGLQIHSETHKENRQRKFECEQCHKKFLTERTYKVHERTHWHREPFKCNLCDKQFMQKVNLRLHMQMHRGETMDCIYCEKKFVRKTDLSVHLRFHTGNFPYECQYCEKRFAIVSHLNYHQKRHQGFIYKCEMCDKEFINMSGLRNHSFQHTAMPFNCCICDKGFPTKFKIKRHLKTVHHVEDLEELERCITMEKIKSEPSIEEANEEVLTEEGEGDQSIEV